MKYLLSLSQSLNNAGGRKDPESQFYYVQDTVQITNTIKIHYVSYK
jgi:hypothetical protein